MSRIDADRVIAPTVASEPAGWITTDDMIEVDRVMIEDLRIELIQMMENAGRHLAHVTSSAAEPRTAAVLVGSGGNGGGGLVAARHLANAGVDVSVVSTRPVAELSGVPAHQADILRRLGIEIRSVGSDEGPAEFDDVDVVVDGIIGYSLDGAPRGPSAWLIEAANASAAPVVSLDVPSGLDATTGSAPGAVVSAAITVTLAAPKTGLAGARQVGALFVADISVPPSVIEGVGGVPVSFGPGGLVRLGS